MAVHNNDTIQMLPLMHGRLPLGTHPTHGLLLKLLGDGDSRLCLCMIILGAHVLLHWKEHSEQVQDER